MDNRSVVHVELSAAADNLLRGIPVIAGFAIVLGFAGWVVSRILSPYYESTSIVVVTNPDQVFRFDPRIETQVNPPPGEGLTEVALSDEIVADLLDLAVVRGLRPSLTVDDLRRDLRVAARGTTLSLRVSCPAAEICARLADRWARLFADKLNEIYAGAGRDTETFDASAADALTHWEHAQAALTTFQASNDETSLEKEFESQTSALGRMLDESQRLATLIADARSVRSRVEATAADGGVRQEDQLLVALLALRSLSSGPGITVASQPSQAVPSGANQVQAVLSPDSVLQISLELGSTQTADAVQVSNYLEQLIASMDSQRSSLSDLLSEAQSHLLVLQAALTQARQDRFRLEEDVELSRETYQTLARKAIESQLAFDEERVAQIATRAVMPDEAAGPSPELFAFSGFLLGLAAGSIWIVLRPRSALMAARRDPPAS